MFEKPLGSRILFPPSMERFRRSRRSGALIAAALLFAAAANAQVVTEFGGVTGSEVRNITTGLDGNLWFTEGMSDQIGRINPQGTVLEIGSGITPGSNPFAITTGPDGNLWFTEQSGQRIGRITPFGVVTEFTVGSGSPTGITVGSDGNLWFTLPFGSRIGRMNIAGAVTEFTTGISTGAVPLDIAAGPDGSLWFTETVGNRIGKITTAGVVTEFSTGITSGAGLTNITAGVDGNLWFTEQGGNRIGRITTAGVVTEFGEGISAGAEPYGISVGPDNNVWFTESGGNRIARITSSGVITEFISGSVATSMPLGITPGPDGNLWYTENGLLRIGTMTTPVEVVVSSMSPSSGPANGVSGAVLAGNNFQAGATVTVGGVPASGVVVNGATQITVDVPALAPGAVYPVTVVDPGPNPGTLVEGWFADFLDVPGASGFHAFVEKLVRNAITTGCGGGDFCPGSVATRGQMAVFLLRSNDGPLYVPPACVVPTFGDVPCSSGFAPWVDELAARGVTAGCGGGNYCPGFPVTRAQMAVFLLRTKEGSAYTPPACVVPTFADVPCSSGFAPWVDELAARGITAGCGGGNYCPGDPVTRGQMAVFLSVTFSLP